MHQPIKQHLIDPEICIRCHTCEEACPIDAITHDDMNVVVDASTCNFCMACIAPCPTGSIDNWRVVLTPYTLEEQLGWMELPEQQEIVTEDGAAETTVEALDNAVAALIAEAHAGTGGHAAAPASAAKPTVNLFSPTKPLTATVQGNYRLTGADTDTDVRHIILDLGSRAFPVLEGQSIGVTPPGETVPRLYSVSSPRDGERPNTNNLALTVKREPGGKASNHLCDLARGDTVDISGPFGSSFLMPDDPAARLIMICTGTGSAPFRAMTMRRQRTGGDGLVLFFGARTPEELPYFGPLGKVPETVLAKHLCFSRVAGSPKEYVQDRMRAEAAALAPVLGDPKTHIYVCGLKGMEEGVDAALKEIASAADQDWASLRDTLRREGRYHVETY